MILTPIVEIREFIHLLLFTRILLVYSLLFILFLLISINMLLLCNKYLPLLLPPLILLQPAPLALIFTLPLALTIVLITHFVLSLLCFAIPYVPPLLFSSFLGFIYQSLFLLSMC